MTCVVWCWGSELSRSRSLEKARARDLDIPFEGTTGSLNAITDVVGVEVGHTTLISGDGPLRIGRGPVRTGVTAVLPRGKESNDPTFAGWFSLNGCGEMTGTTWIEESGFLEGPVVITNTHSVGTVRDAVVAWQLKHFQRGVNPYFLPVVAETYDGYLNDINGFHVKENHVFEALDQSTSGPVAEGNVGGGTGMICYDFKGGIGTASRKLGESAGGYILGVLAQCNYGVRNQLLIAGVPVGLEIPENTITVKDSGSIIIVIATDAPLLPHQLKRLARHASMGIARNGSISRNTSGDLFIAFSTANPRIARSLENTNATVLPNERMNPLFEACIHAAEESVINALVAAETMTGIDGHTVMAIPHDRLRQVMKKYNRLTN